MEPNLTTTQNPTAKRPLFGAAIEMSRLPFRNPFVGLRPFETNESLLFFGRSEQTIELLQQLHRTRLLAVVGSSGCGKSSLIRAGLIPKLKAGFLIEDRDLWLTVTMKPGTDPLNNLAEALRGEVSATPAVDLAARIRSGGATAIINELKPALAESDANLLLLVDQFEEVFSAGDEAADFISILLALAEQKSLPIYVALTMRSDFWDRCEEFYGLPEAMNRSLYMVPRLTRQQRQQAIEGPIRLFGASLTARLLDRVLNDAGDQSDQLPVMQHALMRTWEQWQKEGQSDAEMERREDAANPQSAILNLQSVDVRHYEAIGTIKEALSRDANSAIDGMTAEELKLTERMFMALIEVGENNFVTRHPRSLNELCDITGAKKESVMQLVNIFNDNRRSILTINISHGEENPLIDISHESVVWLWKKLGEWIEAETRSFKVYFRLATTAKRKEMTKATLYSGKDLVEAIKWKKEHRPNAAWAFKYDRKLDLNFNQAIAFLEKSIAYAEIEIKQQENARRLKQGIWNLITPILTYGVLVVVSVAWALASYARVGDPNINPAITPANENLLNWGLRVSTSIIYFMARDLLTLILDIFHQWYSLSPWLRFVSLLLSVLLVTNLFYSLRERRRKSLTNSQSAEDNLLSELSKLSSD